MSTSKIYQLKPRQCVLISLPNACSLLTRSPRRRMTESFVYFRRPRHIIIVYSTAYLAHDLTLTLRVVRANTTIIVYIGLVSRTGHGKVRVRLSLLRRHLNIPIMTAITHHGGALVRLLTTLRHPTIGKPSVHCAAAVRRSMTALTTTLRKRYNSLSDHCITLHLLYNSPVVRTRAP